MELEYIKVSVSLCQASFSLFDSIRRGKEVFALQRTFCEMASWVQRDVLRMSRAIKECDLIIL